MLCMPAGKLFAGTEEEGVFLSTDNGSSWTEVNAGLKQKGINCLAARDSVLFAGTLRGVFSTTDNGAHWTGAGRDSLTATVNAIAVSGPNLLAGTSGLGTYRSTDNSMRWVQWMLACHPSSSAHSVSPVRNSARRHQ